MIFFQAQEKSVTLQLFQFQPQNGEEKVKAHFILHFSLCQERLNIYYVFFVGYLIFGLHESESQGDTEEYSIESLIQVQNDCTEGHILGAPRVSSC